MQQDALVAAGVDPEHIYEDQASGKLDDRPGLAACLKALRDEDTLIVWKLDRLGRNLHHLVNTVHNLTGRGIGFKVLTGHGASIDTTSAAGKLVFGIFAALAEFERELIAERRRVEQTGGCFFMPPPLVTFVSPCPNVLVPVVGVADLCPVVLSYVVNWKYVLCSLLFLSQQLLSNPNSHSLRLLQEAQFHFTIAVSFLRGIAFS